MARTDGPKARSPSPSAPGPLAPHPQRPAPAALRRALRGKRPRLPPPPRGRPGPLPASPPVTCGHGPSHIPAGSGEPRGDGGGGGRSGRREGPVPVRSSAMRGRDRQRQRKAKRCPGPVRPLRSAVPAAAAGRGAARPRAPPAAGTLLFPQPRLPRAGRIALTAPGLAPGTPALQPG